MIQENIKGAVRYYLKKMPKYTTLWKFFGKKIDIKNDQCKIILVKEVTPHHQTHQKIKYISALDIIGIDSDIAGLIVEISVTNFPKTDHPRKFLKFVIREILCARNVKIWRFGQITKVSLKCFLGLGSSFSS